jgi:hypothetical protein
MSISFSMLRLPIPSFHTGKSINVFCFNKIYFNFREKWYELKDFAPNGEYFNQNPSLNLPQGIELTIFEPSFTDYNESLINNMAAFFDIVRITKLDVVFEATFVGMLLDLLRHLPNLDSLRVWSLSLTKPRRLHAEEENINRLISNNNQIRRVSIQQMTELAQVRFLINLCPFMQYFEVGCFSDTNLKSLVVYILRRNRKHITHLRVLCLCMQTANDIKVEELQRMLQLMKSRYKYTIKRISNKIYVQRK